MNGAPVLVDSNIIIDIATKDEVWFDWSSETLSSLSQGIRLVINPIIYGEVSVAYERIEELDNVLPESLFNRENLPWEASFLAGKAFVSYRRNSGTKNSTLPDFLIGAHAAIRGYRIVTRDVSRYRTYFPKVELIAP